MNVKAIKERRLRNILNDVTAIIVEAEPDTADEMDNLLVLAGEAVNYPITAIIGSLVYDHAAAFRQHTELLAYILKVIGGMADIRLQG